MKKLILLFLLFLGAGDIIAQEEAQQYFTVDELPDLTHVLPPPPDSTSAAFALDVVRYMWGKEQRLDPERASIAISDAEYSLNYLIRVFSGPFGMPISFEETPEIYRLLRDFTVTCDNICVKPKNFYMRRRPFMVFHEQTITPEYDEALAQNGSYPSGHTVFGWCAALLLSEINPAPTEALMARGYMYGESRIIVGAHWQSDVEAGMLLVSVLNAKLHTSPVFLDQMAKARSEFIRKKDGATYINIKSTTTSSSDNHIYDLKGSQLPKEPSKGVYIQSGKKLSAGIHP